uniref:Fimbrillin family protein n=1 Tax=Prevotella sp. GTC17262 TaxID=3236797 RepID=A0AB33JJS2_9BACT
MKTTKFLLSLGILASLGMLASCADDDLANGGGKEEGDRGTAVTFTVSDAQDDAQNAMFAPVAGNTRAFGGEVTRVGFTNALSMQGLTPEDLTTQKLPVQGGDGSTCLIETTVAGVNPVKHTGAQTRANISTAITDKFSSIGYRGTTAAGISTTPWFHNKETNADGTLVEDIRWMWAQPYGRFYGISPQVTTAYSKLTVSDASYTSTPYVEFEVEQDVKKQKDLMTACSGVVQYATRFVAPETNLKFHHALTAVRFKVGSNLSWNNTINKVEIIGAKSKGKYTLPTDETGAGAGWSNQSDPQTFTLGGDGTVSVSTSAAVNQIIMGNTGDNYTFYMIPQSLSGVSVKIHFADGSTPISVNLSGTWKPGTTKTYALSQNTSTWQYQLTVGNPAAAAYTSTTAASYTVQSYRTDLATGTQQPVKWKVVGYQESTDGGTTFGTETTTKPAWLTALSLENGDGGTVAESGTATLTKDITDRLVAYNKVMQDATQKGSAGNYWNLSNSTGVATVQNTANSYLISAPGYYRIPLVYGNAIKGGADNPGSYKTSHTGTYILTNFKDHANHDITSPYINVQNSSDPATQASIVWTDQSGIVDGLSVTNAGANSFVNFHVPADKIKNGNAVIAVKNASGTVMWSWHLWFDHDDVLATTPVVNHQGHTYNFTKQTLGFAYRKWDGSTYDKARVTRVVVEQAVSNGGVKQRGYIDITQNPGNVKEISSALYQFGRKDAFPGTDTTPDGSFNKNGGDHMSIQNGIQHPGTFYTYGSSWYDNPPSGYSYYNLWSMENTITGFNDNAVVKTIYDPSPAGFKMPASNAFTGFTTTGNYSSTPSEFNISGDWDNGWNFKGTGTHTVYFPASGYRDSDVGSLGSVGSYGFYWSAVPGNSGYGCNLGFSQWSVGPQGNGDRSCGFSVRPVSE